jgi:4-amino-4-deoxy-L-arabinose transferase-like glycosyltransferase
MNRGIKLNKNKLLMLIIIFPACFLINDNEKLIAYVFAFISTIILFIILKKHKEVRNILITAFTLRMLMAIIYSITGDADPDHYAVIATKFTNMDLLTFLMSIPKGAYFYSWLVAIIWKIIGTNLIVIRLFNALISFLCCLLAYQFSLNFYSKKTSKKILMFIALFPALIRFSSPFSSRETLFVLFLLLTIISFYKFYMSSQKKYLFSGIITFLIGLILHTSMIAFLFLPLFIIIDKCKTKRGFIQSVFLSIIFVLVTFFLIKENIGLEKLYLENSGIDIDKINWIQNSSATGRAAYLENMQINDLPSLLIFLPVKILFFLYAPFIWMVRTSVDLLGLIDGILYLIISLAILKSYIFNRKKESKERKYLCFLLIIIFLMIIMFSIGTSNYGTALRHRAKLIIPLTILSGLYIEKRER